MSYYGYSFGLGIAAVSERGPFGAGWLARAWVDVLERMLEKTQLTKARSCARHREVQAIGVRPGRIAGYTSDYGRISEISIKLPVIPRDQQLALLEQLVAHPLLAAQLVGGELPREIIELGLAVNAPLLPAEFHELQITCSCFDWNNPCKHSAAVYFLLGEELDRDPLLLLTLRGIDRPRLLAQLTGQPVPPDPDRRKAKTIPPAPLSPAPASFWTFTPPALPEHPVAAPPALAEYFPFWTGKRPLADILADFYPQAAMLGNAILAGDDATTE